MRSTQTLISLLLSVWLVLLSGCHKQAPPEKLSKGGELYGRMCAVCHGANGEGYRADQAPRLAQPDFQAAVSDQYLREAIKNGRMGTTMSAWAKDRGGPLADQDVEELIKFLRTWSRGPRATLDEKPANGDIARGSNTYARECFSCHGVKGIGGPNIHIGNPQLMQTATNGYVRYAIRKGRAGTLMPSFSPKLADSDIEDVVALLRTWASPPPPEPPAVPAPPIPLGPVPLNPKGSEPVGFKAYPATTPMAVIHAQLERGARMVLLDARAQSDYMNQHIAGAVSVPFFDPSPYLDKLPKNSWLVCYCACPHAESGQLAAKLQQAGFKKVTVLDEGLGAWSMQKYATSTGEKP